MWQAGMMLWSNKCFHGAPKRRDSQSRQGLPGGGSMEGVGVNCKEREEKGGARGGGAELPRPGCVCARPFEKAEQERSLSEGQEATKRVGLAGGRFSSAFQDFSPVARMGLEGEGPGQNQTGALSFLTHSGPSLPDQVSARDIVVESMSEQMREGKIVLEKDGSTAVLGVGAGTSQRL